MKSKWEFLADLIEQYKTQYILDIGVAKGATVRGVKYILEDKQISICEYIGVEPCFDSLLGDYYAPSEKDIIGLCRWPVFKWMKKTSNQFFIENSHRKFDLIFIDGSHVPEQMIWDIKNYSTLVKDGGIICGHDYNFDYSGEYGDYRLITKFLNEFFGAENIVSVQDTRLESDLPDFLWYTIKCGNEWSTK